ncbi:hypothetical protein ACFL27_15255 [candidate division CSSED10-310 bacterium]|uniref:Uncharacterized protein n=1 Tax=candidate division CSSED10-310 bacterium TaxID=2855610 RepID=A0ABV6YZC8_UNCC1
MYHILIISTFFIPSSLHGKTPDQPRDLMSRQSQQNVITMITTKLESVYPFPDVAKRTIEGLLKETQQNAFSPETDPAELTQKGTEILGKYSNDKHLDLIHNPNLVIQMREQEEQGHDDLYSAANIELYRWTNYGFKELRC